MNRYRVNHLRHPRPPTSHPRRLAFIRLITQAVHTLTTITISMHTHISITNSHRHRITTNPTGCLIPLARRSQLRLPSRFEHPSAESGTVPLEGSTINRFPFPPNNM